VADNKEQSDTLDTLRSKAATPNNAQQPTAWWWN
jgi:hypothetical protein